MQRLVEEFEKNSEGDRVAVSEVRARDSFLKASSEVKKKIASGDIEEEIQKTAEDLMNETRKLIASQESLDEEGTTRMWGKISELEAIAFGRNLS